MTTIDRTFDGERFDRRAFLRSAALFALVGSGATVLAACVGSEDEQAQAPSDSRGVAVALHREEGCSCCAVYADYLRDNGFTVEVNTVDDLGPVRERYHVPEEAVGCHTSVIDDYVVEGHVPVEAIDRLLTERPAVDGISVVGMPMNSPGMGEPDGEPLQVLSFQAGRVEDYLSITTF
jgi:hypothetical protein